MITVVIPTMLLCDKEVFKYSLDQYCSNDLVDTVIVIDNSENQNFNLFYNNKKIKILTKGKNNDKNNS